MEVAILGEYLVLSPNRLTIVKLGKHRKERLAGCFHAEELITHHLSRYSLALLAQTVIYGIDACNDAI